MSRAPRSSFAALACAVLLAASACKNLSSDGRVELASLAPGGAIGIDANSVRARNSAGELGLERDNAVPDLRLDFRWEQNFTPHLTLSGFNSSHGGSGKLGEDLSQGPVTITAGTAVNSKFDVGLYSAALTFDFADSDALEAGLGFGLSWIDLHAAFTSKQNGDEIFTDASKPIPLLAARLAWQGDRFGTEALVSGLGASYGGDRATFVDADLSASMRIFGRRHSTTGELIAGWRLIYSSVQYSDSSSNVDASVTLNGPYLGLALHF